MEPLPVRPECLPVSVLWVYEDCKNDPSGEIIITEANKRRPKLSLAICHPDRQKISRQQYSNMRTSANIIMRRLINFANTDPCSASHTSARTKLFIKGLYPAEFRQAILDLEVEQMLLRLCSGHWKADLLLSQAFLQQGEAEGRAAVKTVRAAMLEHSNMMVKASQHLPPPRVQEVAPANTSKRSNFVGYMLRASADCTFAAILKSEFPSLIDAPGLLHSMNAQQTFKQGKPSDSVATLLERVQSVDPSSPDIDEDNVSQSWGHYQFMAGGLSPSSSLTSWQNIGNIATAFKLVAAAINVMTMTHLDTYFIFSLYSFLLTYSYSFHPLHCSLIQSSLCYDSLILTHTTI
ncbi:hypothetical protein EI94DRAFT_1595124 [Lactarius quietus]|nr:hypothetical protein EI94DRAFT_1595124 [Lactarius quietus]